MNKLPVVTFTVVLLSLLSFMLPSLSDHMIYEREAIISGEIWRLVTAHLVHYSLQHLFYNLLGFGIAGWLIEQHGYKYLGWFCLLSALSISITLFIAKPEMQHYAGISGITYGVIVYFALYGMAEAGLWRALCILLLVSIAIKLSLETYSGNFLFVSGNSLFVPVPLSHLVGSLVALSLFFIQTATKTTKKQPVNDIQNKLNKQGL